MRRELDWDERGALCRTALDFLRFLVGRWEGQGHSHGQAVRARLEGRLRCGDTILQLEESLWDADGALVHEDIALIRLDPDAELVRVTHMMAHAWVSEQLVRPFDGGPGCFWYAGPFSPRAELRPDGPDALDVVVRVPEQPEPDTALRYRRA
ncbi:hypothetical protein L6R53_10455 [Myxococcota bacterium]|nr:hypothetical protein [Myxococcota bacterium]